MTRLIFLHQRQEHFGYPPSRRRRQKSHLRALCQLAHGGQQHELGSIHHNVRRHPDVWRDVPIFYCDVEIVWVIENFLHHSPPGDRTLNMLTLRARSTTTLVWVETLR